MGLKNVKYLKSDAPYIGPMMGLAAQAVGDGLCETALVWYPMVNLEGRYGTTILRISMRRLPAIAPLPTRGVIRAARCSTIS